MDLKERVEKFKKEEEVLKIDLLEKIQEEFSKYGKKKVTFIDPRMDDYFDLPEEIQLEIDGLQDLTIGINPLVMDEYCDIDGTASPAYIDLTDRGLFLHVSGENWDPEHFFITLEKPDWGLSVNDLYDILELLKRSEIKNLNK